MRDDSNDIEINKRVNGVHSRRHREPKWEYAHLPRLREQMKALKLKPSAMLRETIKYKTRARGIR